MNLTKSMSVIEKRKSILLETLKEKTKRQIEITNNDDGIFYLIIQSMFSKIFDTLFSSGGMVFIFGDGWRVDYSLSVNFDLSNFKVSITLFNIGMIDISYSIRFNEEMSGDIDEDESGNIYKINLFKLMDSDNIFRYDVRKVYVINMITALLNKHIIINSYEVCNLNRYLNEFIIKTKIIKSSETTINNYSNYLLFLSNIYKQFNKSEIDNSDIYKLDTYGLKEICGFKYWSREKLIRYIDETFSKIKIVVKK